ncbi:phosphorylase family protein [Nonomuraea fuscirosea]|uniref:5'-methylthioadenosine/S-adenosylhomocysteine nucleosidase family protein n=1 Tax=Nonomuraea fuscirosea TaxID=1291556 RepID=UPI0033C1196A
MSTERSSKARRGESFATPLSFRAARETAAALRRTECYRAMIDTLRPRGVSGLLRSRAPLPAILYLAARDGRLVRQDAGGLALLEPPYDARDLGRPGGFLRRLDRHWDLAMFALPPAVSLVMSLVTLALGMALSWSPWLLGAALVLCLLAMLYVALLMLTMVCTLLFRWILGLPLSSREARRAAEEMRFLHWSMPLCHCPDPARAPQLLGLVTDRLRGLVRAQVARAVGDLSARTETFEVNEPLLCLLGGATTTAMRDAVTTAARGTASGGVTFLATGSESGVRAPKTVGLGTGLALYLVAVAVVLAAESYLVAVFERAECDPACAGRPASYGTAFRWLAWRLLNGNPADLMPATTPAWVVGWLTTLMGFMAVVLFLVTVWRSRETHAERLRSFHEEMEPVLGTTTVLIMVATTEERQAVITAVTGVTQAKPVRRHLGPHTAFELGVVSRARVLVAQTQAGTVAPGGAGFGAQELIERLNPDYLLLTGICYGLREKEQQLGDVLVCTQLRVMDHKKIVEYEPGQPVEIMRGDRVAPSVTLLDRCLHARLEQDEPKVHFGPLLSGNVLLNSPMIRARLKAAEPDGIGGEMEGLGVYGAAARKKVEWIVVKAICDWGMGKTDDWHEAAARNAAEFVVDVLRNQGLDEPPHRA